MHGTMNKPELYHKTNAMQRKDACDVLHEHLDLVRWRPDGRDAVLDIGCGAGDVTWDILRPVLPASYTRLVGTDVSDKMIKYAASKYTSNPRIEFRQLDVSVRNVPEELKNRFDHVFSFYCLHWVQEQKHALANIFSFLKAGGDILLAFLASNPIFDVYLQMAAMPRWAPYMKDVNKFISPYHHDRNVERNLRYLLQRIGFAVGVCKCQEKGYTFQNLTVLQKTVTAISPFIDRIPDNLKEEYFSDYVAVIRNMKFLEENNNSQDECIKVPYKLIVIYASKPL